MRPTRFIIQHIDELSEGVQNDKEILARFMEPAFQDKFKKEFPSKWIAPKEEFMKFYREIKTYDKFMKDTPLECINGNDCDLQYVYQCQECGTIIINDHSSDVCIIYDLLCPTCNKVEDKTPFVFYKYKTKEWIHNMRYAEIIHGESEDGDDFMAGSVANCKFRTTRYMRWVIKRDHYLNRVKEFFKRRK